MSDEIVETAKAAQASASATEAAVKEIGRAGTFFDKVFGSLVVDAVGLLMPEVSTLDFGMPMGSSGATKMFASSGVRKFRISAKGWSFFDAVHTRDL